LEERAAQAMGAIDAVRDHPATDDGIVGIWGQSQGGWIVQMLASRLPDLAFAIANSGPSIGVADQDLYGCEHSMRTDGRSEDEIAHALDFISRVHHAAAIGADFASAEVELIAPARSQSWYRYLTIDDETDWDLVGSFIAESYDPLAALRLIDCPFLAIYGGGDVLLPAWRSAEESGRELLASGNPDAAIVVFPHGDHRIRAATTGEFVTGYLDLLGDWAAHRIRRARSRRSRHAASS
jgi:hypothetical protein